jgi:hypothetical protein
LRRSQAAPEPRTITPKSPRRSVFQRHNADIDIALLEDAVVGQQAFDIVQHLRELRSHQCVDIVDQVLRQVLMHAAGAEIGCVHALPDARS